MAGSSVLIGCAVSAGSCQDILSAIGTLSGGRFPFWVLVLALKNVQAFTGQAEELAVANLQVMGLNDGGVDFCGQHFEADIFLEWGMVVGEEEPFTGPGFADALAFQLSVDR